MKQLIGAGGMGSVWAAHHEGIGRDVAVKVTAASLATQRHARERFQSEARAVGKLQHPNVVGTVDFGELEDGRCYIVFELLDGMSLDRYIETSRRVRPDDAVSIAIDVCRGLEAAHASGVVHRDLKPANVFLHGLGGARVVKLLDFGISQSYDAGGASTLSVPRAIMATPQYMSAEQARGEDTVDPRTDIWGVGVLLYEMISGKLPFDAPTYNAMLAKILGEAPPPFAGVGIEIPEMLAAIVQRCLAKQVNERYESAAALRLALEEVLAGMPSSIRWLPIESISATSTGSRSTMPPPLLEDAPTSSSEPSGAPRPGTSSAPTASGRTGAVLGGVLALFVGMGAAFFFGRPSPSAGFGAVRASTAEASNEPARSLAAAEATQAALVTAAGSDSGREEEPPKAATSSSAPLSVAQGRKGDAHRAAKPAIASPRPPKLPKGVTKVDSAGF